MGFRYNSEGVKMEKEFSVAPEGDYLLKIVKASDQKKGINGGMEDRVTKNGDPYVNVECEIVDGEFEGNKVFHNVTFMLDKTKKGAGIAVHFLKTIGEPWEGDFEVEPERWIDNQFRAHLRVSKDLQGRPKNEIAFVLDDSKDAEVPF